VKPLTMTAKQEATIRRANKTWKPAITHAEVVADRRSLLAEIDALRRLPVIATCGDCRWPLDDNDYATYTDPNWICSHKKAPAHADLSSDPVPPPSWCPLRGAP